MPTNAPLRSAAVVRLPFEVTRGWEWLWFVFHAALLSVLTWAHLTGIVKMTWGSRWNRSSRVPMPDWVVVTICTLFVAMLVFEIWRRIGAHRRAQVWIRDVACHAPHVRAAEVAERIADGMGLDPESFRTLRFERFRLAEAQCGHALPWLWIDSTAVEVLTSAPRSNRLRFSLQSGLAVAKDIVIGTLLMFGLVLMIIMVGGLSAGALSREASIAIGAGLGIAIVGSGLYFALRKRFTIAFIQNRALLLKGDDELNRIQSDSAYIVITGLRYRSNQNSPENTVRWWFFLPGRRPLFADDIPITSTPWFEDIVGAISENAHGQHRSTCPACGYPILGLASATCPECGSTLKA